MSTHLSITRAVDWVIRLQEENKTNLSKDDLLTLFSEWAVQIYPKDIREINPEITPEPIEGSTLNNYNCSMCGNIGHSRNNCHLITSLPKKKTSTWNALHKQHTVKKYMCPCGKQEMNKCNLDRHQRNNQCLKKI
tara:strand:+ start:125 stop:529 length:405 start_codon:yes stop_codon:yes gene_type:complete